MQNRPSQPVHPLNYHIEKNIKNFRFWIFIANTCLLNCTPEQEPHKAAVIADQFARYLCATKPEYITSIRTMILKGLSDPNKTEFINGLKKYIEGTASVDFSNFTAALKKLHEFILKLEKYHYNPISVTYRKDLLTQNYFNKKQPTEIIQPRIITPLIIPELIECSNHPTKWDEIIKWALYQDYDAICRSYNHMKKKTTNYFLKRILMLTCLALIVFAGMKYRPSMSPENLAFFSYGLTSLSMFGAFFCIYKIRELPNQQKKAESDEYQHQTSILKTRAQTNKKLVADVLDNLFDIRITEYSLPDEKEIHSTLSLITNEELQEEEQIENVENEENRKIKRWKTFSSIKDGSDNSDNEKKNDRNTRIDSWEEDPTSKDIVRVIEDSRHSTKLIFKHNALLQISDKLQNKLFERAFKTAKIRKGDHARGTCFRLFSPPVTLPGNFISHIELKVKKYNDRLFGTHMPDQTNSSVFVFSKVAPGLHN